MKWIDANLQYPQSDTPVLCWNGVKWFQGEVAVRYHNNRHVSIWLDAEGQEVDNVTHWARPDLPGQEGLSFKTFTGPEPIRSEGTHKDDGFSETHESYGSIRICRTSSRPRPLFGSTVRHQNYFHLTINECSLERGLSYDRIHPTKELVGVLLSELQLGQMISSISIGEGVPCTIERWENRGIHPSPLPDPIHTRREEVIKKHKDAAAGLDALVTDLEAAVNAKGINKTDRKALLAMATRVRQEINANLPYLLERFDEEVEASLADAKADLRHYATHDLPTLQEAAQQLLGEATKEVSS